MNPKPGTNLDQKYKNCAFSRDIFPSDQIQSFHEMHFFFYFNFYFYFHQKITTQILKSKTYKNFLFNKHKVKNLKVKVKADK